MNKYSKVKMTSFYSSEKRQQAIKELLNSTLISNQKDLVELLKNKFGIETNQSVLSRDLRKLGVTKKQVGHRLVYSLPTLDITIELIKLAVIEVRYNEMMIVIQTHAGLAAFVGDYIDNKCNPNILGCLAGENVVFIACHSIKNIQEVYEAVCQELHFRRDVMNRPQRCDE